MANITKRGKAWRALVRRRGQPAISRTFDSYAEAEAWAATTEAEILAGRRPADAAVTADGQTVADLLARYAREVSPGRRGARWEVIRLGLLQRAPELQRPVAGFEPADLAEWRDARAAQVSAASVNRELNLISAVFTHAIREWRVRLPANPVHLVARPRNPRARTQRVPPDAVTAICAALGWPGDAAPVGLAQWAAFAFRLALATAMRKGEVLAVTWRHVHLARGYLHLPVTKNGDARDVPLSSSAVALLRLLPVGAPDARVVPIRSGWLDALFRRAVRAAGYDGLHFHDTRREATSVFAARVTILELMRITGHRSMKSLAIYYAEDAGELARKLG
jgi:integrase